MQFECFCIQEHFLECFFCFCFRLQIFLLFICCIFRIYCQYLPVLLYPFHLSFKKFGAFYHPHCLLSSYPPLGFQDPHTVPRWSAVPSIVALPNGHLPKYLLEAASSLCHLFPLYTMVYHKLILAFSSNPFIPLLQDPAQVPGPSMGWMRKPGPA